jgi:serine/threonine protein kinase
MHPMNPATSPAEELLEKFAAAAASSTSPDVAEFISSHRDTLDHDIQLQILLIDQARRPGRAASTGIEKYLSICPWLHDDRRALVDLIYGGLRRLPVVEAATATDELCRRYPAVADDLRRQIELNSWLASAAERDLPSDVALADETHAGSPTDAVPAGGDLAEADDAAPLPYSDFAVGRLLGSGGMGQVFEARQRSLGRDVALKVIRNMVVADPQLRHRFLREARSAARLRHPGIAAVYGVGRLPDGGLFIAMELVRGTSVEALSTSTAVPIDEAVRIVDAVAEAMNHAHHNGVVHRDLKPSNVLIDNDGRVVVVDFGLASLEGIETQGITTPSQVIGTPQYLAPEVVDGSLGPRGPGVDVYGLGCLLYVLLTGRPPFAAGSIAELLHATVRQTPIPPHKIRSDVPSSLSEACLKALSKRPSDRHASAGEFRRALQDPGPHAKSATHNRSLRPRRIIIALLALVVLSAIAGLLSSGRSKPVAAEWRIDLYARAEHESRTNLFDGASKPAAGDGIRIHAKLSRPAFAYVYWLDSTGTCKRLFPEGPQTPGLVEQVDIPEDAKMLLPLVGQSAWDACVLIVCDEAAPPEFDWSTALTPPADIAPPGSAILTEDGPIASAPSSGVREKLTAPDRTIEDAAPMRYADPASAWRSWREDVAHRTNAAVLRYCVFRLAKSPGTK